MKRALNTKHGILLSLILLNPNFSFTDDSAALLPVTEGVQVQNKKFMPNPMRCSLVETGLITQNWRWISKHHPSDVERTTEATFFFETSDPACIDRFVIQNFKKGCSSETWVKEGNAETQVKEDIADWSLQAENIEATKIKSAYLKLKPKTFEENPFQTTQWLRKLQGDSEGMSFQYQERHSKFAMANFNTPSTIERSFGSIGSHKVQNQFRFKTCISSKDAPHQSLACFEWGNAASNQGKGCSSI